MKSTAEVKISLEQFEGRFKHAEERIRELEDRIIEIIKAGEQKEIRLKESKQSLRALWDTIKQTNICIVGVTEGEDKEKGAERDYLKKKNGRKLPNLMKYTNINIQEAL